MLLKTTYSEPGLGFHTPLDACFKPSHSSYKHQPRLVVHWRRFTDAKNIISSLSHTTAHDQRFSSYTQYCAYPVFSGVGLGVRQGDSTERESSSKANHDLFALVVGDVGRCFLWNCAGRNEVEGHCRKEENTDPKFWTKTQTMLRVCILPSFRSIAI